MITASYLTPNIYICKSVFQPRGICYGKVCRQRSIRVRETGPLANISMYVDGQKADTRAVSARQTVEIDAYMTTDEDKPQTVTAYILQDGKDPACLKSFPPCSDIYALNTAARWNRDGDYIKAELPLPEHCGVEHFRTDFSDYSFRFDYPAHMGHSDGENLTLTFDDGGLIYHKTRLDRRYLIPGCEVAVSFKLAGFEEYQGFAFYRFETNIFTTAKILGCGIVEKQKVYKNILKPELGYTLEYIAVEGGEGAVAEEEWIYDTRFRYLVEYRGENFWLKTSDFYVYQPDDTAAIIRSIDELPLTPEEPSYKDVKNTLSEDNDIIVPEYFFGGLL